jgi:protein-tyrosine phosphatase
MMCAVPGPHAEPHRRGRYPDHTGAARRLLVGEYPGSRSRADTMDRLKLVLAAGITQFIDLTDESELPSYESLLPFSAPSGRRIEYQREPIPDHGVPTSDEVMTRILATLSAALDSGQIVYLHCRAGIGRSAMVAGCYLVEQGMSGDEALEALQNCWQQSAKSLDWVCVPETDDQYEYVRGWALRRGQATATAAPRLDKSALYAGARVPGCGRRVDRRRAGHCRRPGMGSTLRLRYPRPRACSRRRVSTQRTRWNGSCCGSARAIAATTQRCR